LGKEKVLVGLNKVLFFFFGFGGGGGGG